MAAKAQYVTLETSVGSMKLELYTAHAPRACYNLTELARRGYYDGTLLHRIISDFMIQGGDPTGTGRGGESVYGYVHRAAACGCCLCVMANSEPSRGHTGSPMNERNLLPRVA
jgi:cyclophilin family peptidyl-prolyl cis-trans isomerase